jgi:hypothetical protein
LKGWDPEAWRRGEFDLSFFDPEVTYEDTILPDHIGETYRGHEGIARATMRWIEPYETITIETERAGPLAYVWTFRDGKVVHLKSFAEPEDALEAAGLSE